MSTPYPYAQRGNYSGYVTGASSHTPAQFQSSNMPQPNFTAPSNTSFIFQIDHLAPNWDNLEPQFTSHGHWNPPFYWNAYNRTEGKLYRWKDGAITNVPSTTVRGEQYSCATVFTQATWTQHFLAADFDATTRNVNQHGWQTIGFNHVRCRTSESEYSELDLAQNTDQHHLAAPAVAGSPAWINELFTSQYRYNSQHDPVPPPESAGLIGKLSLLLALVAFSRPRAHLDTVLTQNVRRGRWVAHNLNEHGRTQYRGIIVTIWLDPESPNSTGSMLGYIEEGRYGAFFR